MKFVPGELVRVTSAPRRLFAEGMRGMSGSAVVCTVSDSDLLVVLSYDAWGQVMALTPQGQTGWISDCWLTWL